ncbi:amidophosphoribosyltransferase [Candidatus Berkiella aquae]|uniref:Amidophosphoribosyltransferase n=1 Tax=Candidatus Berkiella aquae TaxID=295108 RepID=A0A0Q9YIB2_9GAMM|nr:amidophosphoribosyltransferase [Candidatus Berkiella aquae]MCS5711735.1 amidophosphoribosyltransferase [Candidatus Berkiella aquae]
MCGIVGIVATTDVNQMIFDALTVLQHRGQDAAGMVTCENKKFTLRKANGLVQDVFRAKHMYGLRGKMGIGHVRYPTAGSASEAEAQPFYVNSPFGIVLAHNGNLTNAQKLQEELFNEDFRHINTGSDSEVILNVLAHELQSICKDKLTPADIFAAISNLHKRCRGGYAVIAMIAGFGVVAFRDPHGIRPLIYGKRETTQGTEIMVASESVALTSQGFSIVDDVGPGEAIIVEKNGTVHRQACSANAKLTPCLFEFVYFARPDSIIDKISVYKVRMNIGKKLADKIRKEWNIDDIDVVIPIPETSRNAAIPLAHQLNVEYREGFVKNRYVGRTFIMPGQKIRKKSVRQKLSVIELEFKNKNVLLIDDSIVRGTTSREIIQLAREAGARKVYFASAAPQIRYPNIYGIDMPNAQELIAHDRSLEEIRQSIGADKLIYIDLEALVSTAREGNKSIEKFESAVFDGIYVTGDESEYLKKAASTRSDHAKKDENQIFDECQIDLHNQ